MDDFRPLLGCASTKSEVGGEGRPIRGQSRSGILVKPPDRP